MSTPAATAGFRALEAERIALIHGPFLTDDFDQKGVAYFQERGFEVVHVSHLMPPIEVPHPNTGSVTSPAEIYEWVRSHVPSSAQAVFIGGNAVRAIGVIAALGADRYSPRTRFLYGTRYAWVVPESRSTVTVSCSNCRADHPIFTQPVGAAHALLELLDTKPISRRRD
jgi:maleate cis-trans isomerase